MIRIEVKRDADQTSHGTSLVRCPVCRQVLLDVQEHKGHGTIRVKCRRCSTYVLIDITDT